MKYKVSVETSPLQTMLDLKGERDFLQTWPVLANLVLPTENNTASMSADMAVYWIGRRHWLIRAPLEQEENLSLISDAAQNVDNVSAIIVSDATTFYRISGPDADQVLSIASPLDVHSSVFPVNGVSYTECFGLKALVLHYKDGYEIGVDRSYADMLGDCFARAIE